LLELRNIRKNYKSGDTIVQALKGISLNFRENEFVSILGPSGCGKTTMLNIIGGLDHYTEGDLLINGVSTKKYKDRDWDTYRNHSIGFVFQSYNLIPHQSVLANVELALTLSGVGKAERRRRAIESLEKVGLGDQINKRPNQLSGGQMQRVAIARAIVNDPDILLADEPTGALDTNTSVQIMDILKEIANDRLIIMVTHNPELAEKYSTRIVKLRDGCVIDDSMPYEPEVEIVKKEEGKKRLSSMSLITAFSLSMKNLMTKKGRTFLAAFAGSIGIIGIAMILSLSNGIQKYIDKVEEDTLSAYPLTIEETTMDMNGMIEIMAGNSEVDEHGKDKVYSQNMMAKVISTMAQEVETNNLKDFKKWLDTDKEIQASTSDIMYSYGTTLNIYYQADDKDVQVNPFDMGKFYGMDSGEDNSANSMNSYSSMFGSSMKSETWVEMPDNDDMMKSQFEVIAGDWADDYDECMLVVDEENEIYDLTLYALGLSDVSELQDMMKDAMKSVSDGTEPEIDTDSKSYDYDDIIGRSYKLVLPTDCYKYDEVADAWNYMGDDKDFMSKVIDKSMDVKITGIIRVREDAMSTSIRAGSIAYTNSLTQRFIEEVNKSDIVKAQKEDENKDVFTGLPFSDGKEVTYTNDEKAAMISDYFTKLNAMEKSSIYYEIMSTPPESAISEVKEQMLSQCPDRESKISFIKQGMEQAMQQAEALGEASDMAVDFDNDMSADEMAEYLNSMSDEDLNKALDSMIAEMVKANYASETEKALGQLTSEQVAAAFDRDMSTRSVDEKAQFFDLYMPATVSDSTYEDNMNILNSVNIDEPKTINIYASSFENKDKVKELIDKYNENVENEEDEITYTDMVGMMMSSLSQMVDIVSYVLIAFVAISLIVSSIMISIITYISVLERTKEIGILRSVGASKKDVSHVFTAETVIEGLVSGLIGIGVTLILNIPINIIVEKLTEVSNISKLPPVGGIILICISVILTLIAGLFPSKMAAKRDPVEALRSE